MEFIAAQLTLILRGLCAAVANHIGQPHANAALLAPSLPPGFRPARPQPSAAVLTQAWHYISRTISRLNILFIRWQAGTLPAPQPPRIRAPRPAPANPKPRLPQGKTWLVGAVGYTAAGRASHLNDLLARPESAEFLRAIPQAARLLRPLCHMLGIDLPPELRLPPRPPRPKPVRPPRPTPPPTPFRNTTRPFTLPRKKISTP